VFYTRCVNAPYTEGHIQVVRMMTKSLLLHGVKSILFNFDYSVARSTIEDRHVCKYRIDQKIPLVTRDSLYRFSAPIAAYAVSMEALKTLRFFSLEKALKRDNYVVNIVNCSRYPRMFLRGLSTAPIILHFYMSNVRLKPMTRILTEKADLIMASSYTLAQYLEKTGVNREKIRVVYPPIDTELHKPLAKERSRSKLGLPMEAEILVYIGGLKPTRFPAERMLSVMKKLAREIPEVRLLVFASANRENAERAQELLRKIRQANLGRNIVVWVKDLTDTEKNMIYSAADVFLFPHFETKTAIEPPLTVLEAMASGAVVVAPETSSLSEIIVDGKNGFLFGNSDFDDLAKVLANVLSNTGLGGTISQPARQTIEEKASLLITGARIVELYRSLLSGECASAH